MSSPKKPRRRLFSTIHPRHPFWGKVIALFAALWQIVWWIWTTLIIGGLVSGALVAYATSGSTGLSAPSTWIVVRPLLAHPLGSAIGLSAAALLTLVAYLAHRWRTRVFAPPPPPAPPDLAPEYGLQRVDQLDPADFLARYVPGVYLDRRDTSGAAADALACQSLRAAATGGTGAPLGLCVYGRPTLGKTRLAWEALRATLPGWTLVRWPHGPAHPLDFGPLRGKDVVLWLDNLQEYASPAEAPALNDLPARFAAAGTRLVVVATCRDGDDETRARAQLGGLIPRLAAIRPADITRSEADALTAAIAKAAPPGVVEQVQVYRDEFDGTPGSLLLGVRAMREERYPSPSLPEDGRRVLRAMTLLRTARIYDYPPVRVRAVAGALFGLLDGEGAWRAARDALVAAGFVRLGPAEPGDGEGGGKRPLVPVADVYLERAVPDYPAPGAEAADDWPALEASLARRRDAAALRSLGVAFNERPRGDLRANQQHAEACYRAALQVRTREALPADWAMTQNNLGATLRDQAGLAEGEERARLLAGAVDAHRAALTVYTEQAAPYPYRVVRGNLERAEQLLAEASGQP